MYNNFDFLSEITYSLVTLIFLNSIQIKSKIFLLLDPLIIDIYIIHSDHEIPFSRDPKEEKKKIEFIRLLIHLSILI